MVNKGILVTTLDNGDFDLITSIRREKGIISRGLSVGDTTHQNQAFILLAHKGEVKEFPTIGVGIEEIANDNQFDLWKREIIRQFEADGLRISKLDLDETGLKLEACYL